MQWCCWCSWYSSASATSSASSWGYYSWESRVSSSRSSGGSDRESSSRKWLCWGIWVIGLEGAECSHVITGIHVTGEGVDSSCPDSLCHGLCFHHWEIVNAEFGSKSCNCFYCWGMAYSDYTWRTAAAGWCRWSQWGGVFWCWCRFSRR